MALIRTRPDGSFVTACALCGKALTEPIFATSHFIADESHDLYRFSDAAMHWACYASWSEQDRFAALYFETVLRRAEPGPWSQYWTTLLMSPNAFVSFGKVVDEVSITLRKSATELRVPRVEWQEWLAGKWRDQDLQQLERDALAQLIPDFQELKVPQPVS